MVAQRTSIIRWLFIATGRKTLMLWGWYPEIIALNVLVCAVNFMVPVVIIAVQGWVTGILTGFANAVFGMCFLFCITAALWERRRQRREYAAPADTPRASTTELGGSRPAQPEEDAWRGQAPGD